MEVEEELKSSMIIFGIKSRDKLSRKRVSSKRRSTRLLMTLCSYPFL